MQQRRGAALLEAASREAQRDAALLLCHVLGKDRAWLLAHPEALLTPSQIFEYEALLQRRARQEPMQYILGEQEFFGLRLKVTPAVLIPRPETEHLVEATLERLPRDPAVEMVDLGPGARALALALAHAQPLARVEAVDLSHEALTVARENAQAYWLLNRVSFLHSDLLHAVSGTFDAIVSNPPYVASSEVLEPQVAEWEPHSALFAGEDGLAIYRRLLPQALERLRPGGFFAGEFGFGQAEALRRLFQAHTQWTEPVFIHDLQGIARVVLTYRRDL